MGDVVALATETDACFCGAWPFATGVAIGRLPARHARCTEGGMLYWAAVFFVVAIVAAVFGFGELGGDAAGVARILFVVFAALAALTLAFHRRLPT